MRSIAWSSVVWPSSVDQQLRRLRLELEVGARSLVEHDPDLLHLSAPVELLLEPHLLGEHQARLEDRRLRPPRAISASAAKTRSI